MNLLIDKIRSARHVLVGAGAGLSAAGGLDYADAAFTAQCFPHHVATGGYKNIMQLLGTYWQVSEYNVSGYYAVWARHIHNIRYAPQATKPYKWLYEQLRDKSYFVITTNVDHQFYKAGFAPERIYAMQGDYGLFQCVRPCSEELYPNEAWVEKTLAHQPDPFHIREEDVPHCPHCSDYLVPNLRMDNRFVGRPHQRNAAAYRDFILQHAPQELLLIEIGVGFNTPSIIRFPFEELAYQFPETVTLIRVNAHQPQVPQLPNCFAVQALGITEDTPAGSGIYC